MIVVVYVLFAGMIWFLVWSKKRMDRGEPLFGRKRRQYLMETADKGSLPFPAESIQALLGIKHIQYGIIEKSKNEYAMILASDSVNYDLLSENGKRGTILGYEQLFKVLSFPVQIVIQAVRQDSRKEIERFRQETADYGLDVHRFVEGVIDYVRTITREESRIVKRVYYIISYAYEPSKNTEIKSEDRMYRVIQELSTRAIQVRSMLKRAQIRSTILPSIEALEVIRRTLNRDRTLAALIDDIEKKEMLSQFVTANFDGWATSNEQGTAEGG